MLKRLPWFKVLALAQVVLLAQRHIQLLEPRDRRRFAELAGRGLRDRRLSASDREELAELLWRLEPRAFAGGTVDRFSPFPLPRRLLYGKRRKR